MYSSSLQSFTAEWLQLWNRIDQNEVKSYLFSFVFHTEPEQNTEVKLDSQALETVEEDRLLIFGMWSREDQSLLMGVGDLIPFAVFSCK